MRVDILTLFPDMFPGVFATGMLRIAREKGLLDVRTHDFRRFAKGVHQSVDDKPFGGGPGMVLKPEPVFECLESVLGDERPLPKMLLMTPDGAPFTQKTARALVREPRIVILCGRYEGFDERIRQGWPFEAVSIGDYVLSGGELASMTIVDAVTRLIPGVVGHGLSTLKESFEQGLLDHPHYTRPASFRGMDVPEVLLSGDHERIAAWRHDEALRITKERRPDLLRNLPERSD